jgi:hypothetical protein
MLTLDSLVSQKLVLAKTSDEIKSENECEGKRRLTR